MMRTETAKHVEDRQAYQFFAKQISSLHREQREPRRWLCNLQAEVVRQGKWLKDIQRTVTWLQTHAKVEPASEVFSSRGAEGDSLRGGHRLALSKGQKETMVREVI